MQIARLFQIGLDHRSQKWNHDLMMARKVESAATILGWTYFYIHHWPVVIVHIKNCSGESSYLRTQIAGNSQRL